jgi:hypothetical protein
MIPMISSRRAPHKHKNTKTDAPPAKIGGGNSAGAAAGGISTFSNVFHINTMFKGSSPPMDYGFVIVACYILIPY